MNERQIQYLRDGGHRLSVPFRSAHHEAAHAVGAIYGLRETRAALPSPLVNYVKIYRIKTPLPGRLEEGRFWTGICHGPWIYRREKPQQPPGTRPELEWDLVATMAGSIAETIYCWYRGAETIEEFARNGAGGGHDFRRVDYLMSELCAMSKRKRVLRPYVMRTIAFVKTHWGEIEALARVLVEKKKIEGDQIAEIVDGARVEPGYDDDERPAPTGTDSNVVPLGGGS